MRHCPFAGVNLQSIWQQHIALAVVLSIYEPLQELNAFASQQLDFDLEEEAPPAYGDAFAARPGQSDSLFAVHCFHTTEKPKLERCKGLQ